MDASKIPPVGKWHFGKRIPLELAASLVNFLNWDFEKWAPGRIPSIIAINIAKREKELRGKSRREIYNYCLNQFNPIEHFGDECYAEHCLVGSTIPLSPDPFISLSSYFSTQVNRKHQTLETIESSKELRRKNPEEYPFPLMAERSVKDNLIMGNSILYSRDPLVALSESWESFVLSQVNIKTAIDIKTGEGYIIEAEIYKK